jgi:hypothetical protein
MLSRRLFLTWLPIFATVPYRVTETCLVLQLVPEAAEAKNSGGNGNDGGNGKGNGSGNGNAGDSNAGDGGNGNGSGNGNSGKSENSNSNGSTNSNSGASGSENGTGAVTAGSATNSNPSLDVHHLDGLRETIQNGRYVMKDSKGRTIVNRRASRSDEERLRGFLH